MINKKSFILILLITSFILLSGCGDKKIERFQDEMTGFKDNIINISFQMDNIDAESDNAITELLTCLDNMNEEFQILAAIEIPKKFINIESLADEAATYMSEAVTLYHEFYESGYDDSVRQAADENYKRAMKRMNYISILLQGKIPDDAEIMVTEEDGLDFEPVTEEENENEFNYDPESDVEQDFESEQESEVPDVSTEEANNQEDGPVKVGSKSNN